MSLIQLYIPRDVGHSSVLALGELGQIQFVDLNEENNRLQRPYTKNIWTLDGMEKKLEYLIEEARKLDIPVPKCMYRSKLPSSTEMEELAGKVDEYERRIRQISQSYEELVRKQVELVEHKHILDYGMRVFSGIGVDRTKEMVMAPIQENHWDMETGMYGNVAGLGFLYGVIPRYKYATLENILWRVLRGNMYMTAIEIEEPIIDPKTLGDVKKNIFIISAHGSGTLDKSIKISESLGASFYKVGDYREARSELPRIEAQLMDVSGIVFNTKQAKINEMMQIADSLDQWRLFLKCEKSIYHTLNMFSYDPTKKCLIAEGWTPTRSIPAIVESLGKASLQSNSSVSAILKEVHTTSTPPTYNRTNKFTEAIQNIVDSYGIASYKELNPALFSLITFPFLFAIMFGDFGHGFLITLFAFWMVMSESSLSNARGDLIKMVFDGRYLILLMGIFSMYLGLIYNDVFSKNIHCFQSAFSFNSTGFGFEAFDSQGYKIKYPFGIDCSWHGTSNSLLFLNSYKMKQSIVLGIIHMVFGIFLSLFNYIHFSDFYGIFGIFVPQLLLMLSIFGYMGVLIVFKWITQTPASPSILDTMINMFLNPGVIDKKNEFYQGQGLVQSILMVVAVICIPWMLLAKPLLLRRQHMQTFLIGKKIQNAGQFNLTEELVHSGVHTIEFVLGTVSNTASYLRLWALSLAHAQLSEVLWDMTAERAHYNVFVAILMFPIWFISTIVVLIAMEGLSAFLHALRLHWVEFNNKFYSGTGYKFQPFSYNFEDSD